MPLTPTVTKAGSTSWRIEWSGTPPYRVYLFGQLILDTVTDTDIVMYWSDSEEPPPLEVLDSTDTDDADNVRHSPRLTIQWRGATTNYSYAVEQYIDAVWTTVRTVRETGSGYYEYVTDTLTDATEHKFRVVPKDIRNYEGQPLPFTVTMIRNPAPPVISMAYAAGDLTISERS